MLQGLNALQKANKAILSRPVICQDLSPIEHIWDIIDGRLGKFGHPRIRGGLTNLFFLHRPIFCSQLIEIVELLVGFHFFWNQVY